MPDRARYYLTTAIAYANNKPGLHTLYEVVGADVIARWHRMKGDDTRFLTGTDEHSINIAQSALDEGRSARAFVDTFAAQNAPEDLAEYVAGAFGADKQARELADPALRYLVAEDGGVFVGAARLGFGAAPAALRGRHPAAIARFYAAKDYIGRGVGRALMEHCLQAAARSGCDVLWLGVWEKNTRAIEFYAKWDFIAIGTTVFQLGKDAQTDLLMARAVAPAA